MLDLQPLQLQLLFTEASGCEKAARWREALSLLRRAEEEHLQVNALLGERCCILGTSYVYVCSYVCMYASTLTYMFFVCIYIYIYYVEWKNTICDYIYIHIHLYIYMAIRPFFLVTFRTGPIVLLPQDVVFSAFWQG